MNCFTDDCWERIMRGVTWPGARTLDDNSIIIITQSEEWRETRRHALRIIQSEAWQQEASFIVSQEDLKQRFRRWVWPWDLRGGWGCGGQIQPLRLRILSQRMLRWKVEDFITQFLMFLLLARSGNLNQTNQFTVLEIPWYQGHQLFRTMREWWTGPFSYWPWVGWG